MEKTEIEVLRADVLDFWVRHLERWFVLTVRIWLPCTGEKRA